MKIKRELVYKLIDDEREYQNNLHGELENLKYSVSDWLIYIRKYLNEAENAAFEDNEELAMVAIKKLTSLGVASLENKGCSK